MKQIYLTIKINIIIGIMFLSQIANSQCQISSTNGTSLNNISSLLMGQGFIAECDGELEYVQFIAGETGTVSNGTLNVYSGNNVSGTPIYTQSYSSITINNIGDPIRINIANTLALTLNSQYTFEFTVDNGIDIFGNLSDVYPGGSAFQNGEEFPSADWGFTASILNSTLSIDDFNKNENLKLFPNPSSEYVQISGLKELVNYKIYNVLGTEIKKGVIANDKQIDIKYFINGLYFLKFDNGNTIKFIKE